MAKKIEDQINDLQRQLGLTRQLNAAGQQYNKLKAQLAAAEEELDKLYVLAAESGMSPYAMAEEVGVHTAQTIYRRIDRGRENRPIRARNRRAAPAGVDLANPSVPVGVVADDE